MKHLRILILDDEPLIAMMLQEWLTDLGCEPVGPAHTVDAALALLDDGRIDGAILDVTLGAANSYPVADALLQRAIPFIFATGHDADSMDQRFRHITMLAKPFDFKAVNTVIAKLTTKPGS